MKKGKGRVKLKLGEIEVKVSLKTIFGSIFIAIGVTVIFYAIFRSLPGVEDIITLLQERKITEAWAFIETFGWFFALLIQVLAGYFLASIGIKIAKK